MYYTENHLKDTPYTYEFLIWKLYGYIPSDTAHKLLLMNTPEYRALDQLFVQGEFDDEYDEYYDNKSQILQDFLDSQPPIIN